MHRSELMDLLKNLKLGGMVATFDEIVTKGVRREQTVQEILGQLCQAEAVERKVRSILATEKTQLNWSPTLKFRGGV